MTTEGPEEKQKTRNEILADSLKERISNLGVTLPETNIDAASNIFENVPVTFPERTVREKLTFGQTVKERFLEQNEVVRGVQWAQRTISDNAPRDYLSNEIPAGWTPATTEALDGLSDNYWGYVLNATSPKDQIRRRMISEDLMEQERRLENGTILGNLVGAAAGIIASPSALVPILTAASKMSFVSHTFGGAAKVIPGLAIQSFAHEGILQATSPEFNSEEVVQNTVRDTMFGAVLYGAGRSVTFGAKTAEVWKARKVLNDAYDGVGIKTTVDAEGNRGPLLAFATDDSVGAAKVKEAQEFIDGQPVFNGLSAFLGKIGTAPLFGSEVLKGLQSRFPSIVDFTNKLVNHAVKTKGIKEGYAKPETAEEMLRAMTNLVRQKTMLLDDLYVKSIGVEPGATSLSQVVLKRLKENKEYSRELFNERVARATLTGEESTVKEVNEGVSLMREQLDSVYKDFLETHDFPPDIAPPRTAKNYLMQAYNKEEMVQRPQDFLEMAVDSFKVQDEQIMQFQAPLNQLKTKIEALRSELDIPVSKGGRKEKVIRRDIKVQNKKLAALNKQMIQDMKDGKIDMALLDDRAWMTSAETEELKEILKPLNSINKKIETVRAEIEDLNPKQRAEGNKLEKEINKLEKKKEAADQKQLDGDKAAAKEFSQLNSKILKLEAELKAQKAKAKEAGTQTPRDKLKALKKEREDFLETFHSEASAGDINTKLFINKNGRFIPRDINAIPKFRKLFSSRRDMQGAAQATYDSILNLTPEQLNAANLNKFGGGGTDPSSARTFLIPSVNILDSGFLNTDLNQMLMSYTRTLGRRTALKRMFADANLEDGMKGLSENLSGEIFRQRQKILDTTERGSKKQKKALSKLNKDAEKNNKFLKQAYDAFMGNVQKSDGGFRVAKALTSLASIMQLRNVPLLQSAEISGIVFRQGLWDVVTGGMVPLIEKMNPLVKTPGWSDNASHALVAVEDTVARMAQNIVDGVALDTINGTVLNSKIERFINKSARSSQALFGTNMMTNFLQTFSANVTQSRVMSELFKFKAGKLSQRKIDRMLLNGIDPKDADLYIAAFEKAGGYKRGTGGYVSNWYKWGDTKLSNNMRLAIDRDIRASILEAGLLDKPFAASQNAAGTVVFQYMGYLYSAFNNFAIPLAQSPDADKIFGMLMLISISSMMEPMRRWQKGEGFFLDDDKAIDQWAVQGIVESGVLGWPLEILQRADAMLAPDFMNRYRQDKFRRRPVLGVLAGPAGSYLDSVAQVMSMVISGEYNQKDLKKAASLNPVGMNLLLDKEIKKFISNSNLPETRAQARR